MANTTNYNWETPDDTDLVKDGALAIRTLGNSIDTTTKNLNPETTTGDIAYRSATANTNTRLAIGSAGQVLTVAGGVPSWATPTDQTPLTTKGDLFTFSTVDARLGVGANGTVLTADSAEATGLKWAAPAGGSTFVGCALVKNASQSISNGTETALTFATETYDTDGFHDNSTNTSRITIPSGKGGKYLFTGVYAFADNATGIRYLNLKTNGSASLYLNNANATSSSSGFYCFSFVLSLVATDYVEMFVFQNSGSSLNASTDCRFQASYLGA
tara:strand:- start:126 stop:941 length:816 start_codon:yes stop_codon:yes gene_type:complete